MQIHDDFNFDTKLLNTLDAGLKGNVNEIKNGIGRLVQSYWPEKLVQLGMANNYTQWGHSSPLLLKGTFENDGGISWLV